MQFATSRVSLHRSLFAVQPSVEERLIRELSTGNFIVRGENVLMFCPPGVGKTHLAIGLGPKDRRARPYGSVPQRPHYSGEPGESQSEGAGCGKVDRVLKPRLLIIDEQTYLPFERRSPRIFPVGEPSIREESLLVTLIRVSEWGTVFGSRGTGDSGLDRLRHHPHPLTVPLIWEATAYVKNAGAD